MKPAISLNQCRLYRCGSKRALAQRLEISIGQLSRLPEWRTYRTFEQEKLSCPSETRTIYAPEDDLKGVQGRIQHLLQRVRKPSWVYSGTKGVCHVDNALSHAGNRYFVLTDISSFYDHCTRDAVYRFFRNDLKCAPDVAGLLATITTYDKVDGSTLVPTGSPCSQLVAYFAYRRMFDEISELAERYGCRLSLYVDDLTLSSIQPIGSPRNLEKEIARVLRAYGHKIKWRKTGYFGADSYKLVTGVALDGRGTPKIPNRLGKNVLKGMHDVIAGDEEKIAPTIGRIGAARQIVDGAFPEVARVISAHQE
jgi:RNA-directed DNA polymerase